MVTANPRQLQYSNTTVGTYVLKYSFTKHFAKEKRRPLQRGCESPARPGPALDAGGAGKQSTERKAGSRVRCAVGVVRFEQLAGGLVARPTGLKLGLSDGYCYRRGSAEPARQ